MKAPTTLAVDKLEASDFSPSSQATLEAMYRSFYEDCPDGLFSVDRNGVMVDCNPKLTEMIGVSKEQLLGRSSFDLVPPENHDEVLAYMKVFLDTGRLDDSETRLSRSDGSVMDISISATALRDERGEIIQSLSVVRDISGRKSVERALKASESKFRTIYEHAPVMVCGFDRNGRCIFWNRECERMLGWTSEEVLSMDDPLAAGYPDEEVRKLVRERIQRGDGTPSEFTSLAKDGSTRTIMWTAFPMPDGTLISAGMDITDRKQAERGLESSEARFRQLAENVRVIPWEAETATWNFTYVGPHAAGILGYPLEEWYQPGFWESHMHPGDRDQAIRYCQKQTASVDDYEFDYRMLSADNEEVWFHDVVNVVRDKSGPVSLRGVMVDVTERKRTARELEQSESRFRQIAERVNFIPWEADPRTWDITYVGPQAVSMLGFPVDEWLKPHFWPARVVHPADITYVLEALQTGVATNDDFEFEYRAISASGEVRWWCTFVNVVRDESGTVTAARGVSIDISERKLAAEEQTFLLRELDHRVKNVLATVESIAQQTLRSSSSLDSFADAFGGRVRTLARVHQVLSRSEWLLDLNVPQLVETALEPFSDPERARVILTGDTTWVPVGAVRPLAMAIYELATNAAKYGALSTPDGRVHISCGETTSDRGADRVNIEWVEEGGPEVTQPGKRGMGTILIEESLPYELGASVELEFVPSGVRCRIAVPCNRAGAITPAGRAGQGQR